MERYGVEGHADLARDPQTNSILNVNKLDYEQYVARRAAKKTKRIKRYRVLSKKLLV